MSQSYVAGFLFDGDVGRVILLRKSRPEWQRGLLNGVGGKIEPGETIHSAMLREGFEEIGINTNWQHFVTLAYPGADIAFFYSIDDRAFQAARACEDEPIVSFPLTALVWSDVIPNLRFLVPMAAHAASREMMVPARIVMLGHAAGVSSPHSPPSEAPDRGAA